MRLGSGYLARLAVGAISAAGQEGGGDHVGGLAIHRFCRAGSAGPPGGADSSLRYRAASGHAALFADGGMDGGTDLRLRHGDGFSTGRYSFFQIAHHIAGLWGDPHGGIRADGHGGVWNWGSLCPAALRPSVRRLDRAAARATLPCSGRPNESTNSRIQRWLEHDP